MAIWYATWQVVINLLAGRVPGPAEERPGQGSTGPGLPAGAAAQAGEGRLRLEDGAEAVREGAALVADFLLRTEPLPGVGVGGLVDRCLEGVREEVWNFYIGGYQVCEKWLKDRKGRTLSKDDLAHYHKIVVALSETIRLMQEIDEVIEQHGGWPGAFQTGKAQP
jgi:hypothetical protein